MAALDLDALDHFLDDAAKGQADPRHIGFPEHDGHVLFRPRHLALLPPGLERPVAGAALQQGLAQGFLLDAQLAAQLEPFVIGRDRGPEDQIVDHLADLSGAEIAQVENGVGEGRERRPAGLEHVPIATGHDQKLALFRRPFATAQGRVEERHPAALTLGREPLHGAGRDGRGYGDDGAFPGRRQQPVRAQDHLFGLGIEADDDDDEIAFARHFRRVGGLPGAERRRRRHGLIRNIEAGDGETLLDQVPGHRPSHAAEPDDADTFDLFHARCFPSPVFRPSDIVSSRDEQFGATRCCYTKLSIQASGLWRRRAESGASEARSSPTRCGSVFANGFPIH